MERAQFEATVKKLELFSAQEPQQYRRRIGLLAALGYGYILLVLLAVISTLAVLVWIAFVGHHLNAVLVKLGFFLLIFAFIVLRSLWVRFPPPSGIILTREKSPRLFAVIDDMTAKLQAPSFHQIILNDEFNAAVMQIPRLGLLGWQKNYLLLGLPLMQALSPEEFHAVVAHELGHLSGNHGKFGGWIYRINQTWEQLRVNFSQAGHGGGLVFEKFINWYAPYFGAYSFVLRRTDEYVADRCAAELTSPSTAASALVGVSIKGRYVEELFWPGLFNKVVESPEAPTTPFSELATVLRAPFNQSHLADEVAVAPDHKASPPPLKSWLARAFRDKTDYTDTHPSLTDRLRSLGFQSQGPDNSQPEHSAWLSSFEQNSPHASAASYYLESNEQEFTDQLNKQWHQAISEQWKRGHEAVQQSKIKLKELESKAQSATLSREELWEQATLTRDLIDDDTAFPLIQQLLVLHPNHAEANFVAGQILLKRGDDMGIENLLCAARLESDATLASYGIIYNFLLDHGREAEAEEYRERAYGFQDEVEKALEERARISDRDEYLAPTLSELDLSRLNQLLQTQSHIAEAYLVSKKVEHFNDKPLHVLGLKRAKTSAFKLSADNEKIVNDFIILLQSWEEHPIGYVFVMDSSTKKLSKKIEAIPEAKIYGASI